MNSEIYEEQYQPEEPLKSDLPEHDPQGSVPGPPSAPETGSDAHEDVSSPEHENEDNSPAKDNASGEDGVDAEPGTADTATSEGSDDAAPPPKKKRASRKKAAEAPPEEPQQPPADELEEGSEHDVSDLSTPGDEIDAGLDGVPDAESQLGTYPAESAVLPAGDPDALDTEPSQGIGSDDDLDAISPEQEGDQGGLLVMGLASEVEEPPAGEAPADESAEEVQTPTPARSRSPMTRPRENRPVSGHTPLMSLNLNEMDRGLSREEREEWNEIYASYRSKSLISGRIIGVDGNSFYVRNKETGALERRRMYCAVVIAYRVKVLIPETEFWMPGEERPTHVLRNMTGAEIDYMILDVDREGGVAIASRRMGAAAARHRFDTQRGGHSVGERLTCRVLAVGPSRCLLECGGRDITLGYRDMSYANLTDLREKYHPGQTLDCVLTAFNRASGEMEISVKEAEPHPFQGIATRHPIGSRRYATITGKYGGGVFCTLPDGTTCMSLYTPQHTDRDFHEGDTVILVITQFDYDRCLIYGRILAKW